LTKIVPASGEAGDEKQLQSRMATTLPIHRFDAAHGMILRGAGQEIVWRHAIVL
jgi:hypothetical protein